MASEDDPRAAFIGHELDWLATDHDGHVAVLSTFGSRHFPRSAALHATDEDAAVEALLAGPPVTEASSWPEVADGYPNPWRACAEHGVFAFEASPSDDPYRRIATPGVPALLEDVDPLVAAVAARRRFGSACFARDLTLRPEDVDALDDPQRNDGSRAPA